MRTGISIMGFGVVIAKLRYLFPPGTLAPPARGAVHASNIGLLLAILGLLTVVLAAWHYHTVRQALRAQRFQASNRLVVVFVGIVVVLGLLIVWYLLQGTKAGP
jgi:putative membrane protein